MTTKPRLSAHVPRIAGSILTAVALWGCEESPTEPSASPSLSRAGAGAFTLVDLGTLGGRFSAAFAINPASQVVGFSETASGEIRPFLWEKGIMTDLGTLGGTSSFAGDINPAGQVVGTIQTAEDRAHAFVWARGVTTDLGEGSSAFGINPASQVVGATLATAPDDFHATLWTRKSAPGPSLSQRASNPWGL